MADDGETERVAVRTYVPKYQKSEWADHAERLDMSQSEFVRTMVQAGRRGFDFDDAEPRSGGASSERDPGGEGVQDRVVATLRNEGPMAWDELLEELAGSFEDRLEEALDDLQSADRIRYSGRDGGYVIRE